MELREQLVHDAEEECPYLDDQVARMPLRWQMRPLRPRGSPAQSLSAPPGKRRSARHRVCHSSLWPNRRPNCGSRCRSSGRSSGCPSSGPSCGPKCCASGCRRGCRTIAFSKGWHGCPNLHWTKCCRRARPSEPRAGMERRRELGHRTRQRQQRRRGARERLQQRVGLDRFPWGAQLRPRFGE